MDEETLVLGGNIELTGFKAIDRGSLVVVKKIVGNYVRKLSEITEKLEKFSVVMKQVHNNQYELHAKLIDNGKAVTSEVIERNLFFALDKVLAKIETEIKK